MMKQRNQDPLEQSQVSCSSSSSNNYEYIPRDDPFYSPIRDVPAPKASFPFRKVQSGAESLSNRSANNSQSSIKQQLKRMEGEQKVLIEVIDQLNDLPKMSKKDEQEWNSIGLKLNREQYQAKVQQYERKIQELEKLLQSERYQNDFERKANEIYTDGFAKIKDLVISKGKTLEGESIEELVDKLADLLKAQQGDHLTIIDQQERKISQLRVELLKSTQNNINAIFNTEITQAYCLQFQITKMNTEIMSLKEKLIKATSENQDSLIKIMNTKNSSQTKKIVKIYKDRAGLLESQSDDDVRKQLGNRQVNRKRKSSKESSSSEKHRSKRLSSTELKMGQLIEGYKLLRGQYGKLEGAIKQINGSQTDFKDLFSTLKKQISHSIQNQILEVKETIKRPSSNHEQLKIARQLQSKLNDLVNTLNSPERVNLERSTSEQSHQTWKSVEVMRRVNDLQSKNSKLDLELRNIKIEKKHLEETIDQLTKYFNKKEKNNLHHLCIQSVESKQKKSQRLEEQSLSPRTQREREQLIQDQASNSQQTGHIVHSSGFNKLHSSQSHHQSSSKHTEIQQLQGRIIRYDQLLREKDLRITELENTILDHIELKAEFGPQVPMHDRDIKSRYELYISNLKMLLNESRKEYDVLKKELIKSSQMSLSRAQNDMERNSITLSDRTTKNHIGQTRLIQRRTQKTNSFEVIKARLEIQEALEKAFQSLLELGEKILEHKQVDQVAIVNPILDCLRALLIESRQRQCRPYEDLIGNEQLQSRLSSLGITAL